MGEEGDPFVMLEEGLDELEAGGWEIISIFPCSIGFVSAKLLLK